MSRKIIGNPVVTPYNVEKFGTGGGVGQATDQNGEIFNDYENNQALTEFSTASGSGTVAGKRATHITAISDDFKTLSLNTVDGLEVGDIISHAKYSTSAKAWQEVQDVASIVSISGNSITVDAALVGVTQDIINDADKTGRINGKLWVNNKPDFGDTDLSTKCTASGRETKSIGEASFSSGRGTTASGAYSGANGHNTLASGDSAFAVGKRAKAKGMATLASGLDTIASTDYSRVSGLYNLDGNFLDIVGNGSSNTQRSNAYTLDKSGNAVFAGTVTTKNGELMSKTEVDTAIQNAIGVVLGGAS